MNLFKSGDLTADNVRELLGSKDDTEMRQLRIAETGDIYLSDKIGNIELDGVRVWFESWTAEGYCGEKAAADEKYVDEILTDLVWIRNNDFTGFYDGQATWPENLPRTIN